MPQQCSNTHLSRLIRSPNTEAGKKEMNGRQLNYNFSKVSHSTPLLNGEKTPTPVHIRRRNLPQIRAMKPIKELSQSLRGCTKSPDDASQLAWLASGLNTIEPQASKNEYHLPPTPVRKLQEEQYLNPVESHTRKL